MAMSCSQHLVTQEACAKDRNVTSSEFKSNVTNTITRKTAPFLHK